jgi:hypothetical protein
MDFCQLKSVKQPENCENRKGVLIMESYTASSNLLAIQYSQVCDDSH